MAEHWREVRVREAGNRLVCRFDPHSDRIEIMLRGRLVIVNLADYRSGSPSVSINFDRIEGLEGLDETEQTC
jgi:hypothetical protein